MPFDGRLVHGAHDRAAVWRPAIAGSRAAAIRSVVDDITDRLRDRDLIAQAVQVSIEQAPESSPSWREHEIAEGWAGLALVCAHLHRREPHRAWDILAHEYLTAAFIAARERPAEPHGLFSGLAGIGFAAWYLAAGDGRYSRLLADIDPLVADGTHAVARQIEARGPGCDVSAFDLISGLSGTVVYLLCRHQHEGPAHGLRAALAALVALSRESGGLPGWHTPATSLDAETREQHPDGNVNCGLAHGVPAPLAALSLALQAGCEVPGQRDAIDRAGHWLAGHRCDDAWGVNWGHAVPLAVASEPGAALRTAPDAVSRPARAGWCYGAPGVARALWLAGRATGSRAHATLAKQAMDAVFARPVPERELDSPTFCHGVAGLLQIALRFGADTGREIYRAQAADLADQLLAAYDPASLLGYRSLQVQETWTDNPGLLDGAFGIALALLAAIDDVEPDWDRLFLLS